MSFQAVQPCGPDGRKPETQVPSVIVSLAMSPDICIKADTDGGKKPQASADRQAIQAEGIDVTVQTATVNAVQEAAKLRTR